MALTKSSQGSEPLYFEMPEFMNDGVFHGFFGRRGGKSSGIYSSLNCGPGSNDDPAAVKANRAIVSEAVGCDPERFLTLYQVHGDACVMVGDVWGDDDRPKADGMVTDQPGFALGILTADCGPALFHGQKDDGSPVIGAAHAGWGGALKGVLSETVEQMKALGAVDGSIQACVGPCIAQASYEVQDAFAKPFMEEDDENERFFKSASRVGHLMFDLPGYCAFKLSKAGVRNVFIRDLDTYANEGDFFSYRRTTHRGENDYGRQVSVIMIRPSE